MLTAAPTATRWFGTSVQIATSRFVIVVNVALCPPAVMIVLAGSLNDALDVWSAQTVAPEDAGPQDVEAVPPSIVHVPPDARAAIGAVNPDRVVQLSCAVERATP